MGESIAQEESITEEESKVIVKATDVSKVKVKVTDESKCEEHSTDSEGKGETRVE